LRIIEQEFFMDEEMMQMMAMEQALGGAGGGADMAAAGPADPFGEEAPPGYTTVYVPDSVLPAVMELVSQAEGSPDSPEAAAMQQGAPDMAAMAGMGDMMGMGDMSGMGEMPPF
jgi:hypothetical protein